MNRMLSSFFRHVMKSPVLMVVLCVLVCIVGCTNLFFRPARQFISSPEVEAYAPHDIYFKSSDGVLLHGWYFRARAARGTILICHGNVENISTHVKLDLWLIDGGYNIFIFDFRGYGRSGGRPDVQGVHLDAEAALETLLQMQPRTMHDRVVVFGKSLGGAVAVYMVAHSPYKDRVKALILDSVFSSYRDIAQEKIACSIIGWPVQYPLAYLVNDDYSPVKFIKQVAPVPVVLIHGSHDDIVPGRHSRVLYDAALAPKELWEIALPGHVKAQQDAPTRKRLLDYLAALP